EAEQTDAYDRGYRDGLVAGDRRARQTAIDRDYPRGRKEYRDGRFAEPIQSEDAFSQLGPRPEMDESKASPLFSLANAKPMAALASPDYRFSNPRRTFPTPQENSAY